MPIQFSTTASLDSTNPTPTIKEQVAPVKTKLAVLAEVLKTHGKCGVAASLLPAGYLVQRFMATPVDKLNNASPITVATHIDVAPLAAAMKNQTLSSLAPCSVVASKSAAAAVEHPGIVSMAEQMPSVQANYPWVEKALIATKETLRNRGDDVVQALSSMDKANQLGLTLFGAVALGLTTYLLRRRGRPSSKASSIADITFRSASFLQKSLREEMITAADIGLPRPVAGSCATRNSVYAKICAGKDLATLKSIYIGLLYAGENVDWEISSFRDYLQTKYPMDDAVLEKCRQENPFKRVLEADELGERLATQQFITAENMGLPVPGVGVDAYDFYRKLFEGKVLTFKLYGNLIDIKEGVVKIKEGVFDENLKIALWTHKRFVSDFVQDLYLTHHRNFPNKIMQASAAITVDHVDSIPAGFTKASHVVATVPDVVARAVQAELPCLDFPYIQPSCNSKWDFYTYLFAHCTPQSQERHYRALLSYGDAVDESIAAAKESLKLLLPPYVVDSILRDQSHKASSKDSADDYSSPSSPPTPPLQSLSPAQAASGAHVFTPAALQSTPSRFNRSINSPEQGMVKASSTYA